MMASLHRGALRSTDTAVRCLPPPSRPATMPAHRTAEPPSKSDSLSIRSRRRHITPPPSVRRRHRLYHVAPECSQQHRRSSTYLRPRSALQRPERSSFPRIHACIHTASPSAACPPCRPPTQRQQWHGGGPRELRPRTRAQNPKTQRGVGTAFGTQTGTDTNSNVLERRRHENRDEHEHVARVRRPPVGLSSLAALHRTRRMRCK